MLYVLYQRGDLLKAAYNLPCFFTKWDKGRLFLGGKHYDLNSRKDAKERGGKSLSKISYQYRLFLNKNQNEI